ncbi:hypothetical protein EST38_g289 [Candolleomyces aberdarensis]|uniref:Uncharacterized protein n=1 Tax=Candolleomyces aberdarensis TaxID=2316362 RepID=A0A4Q2DXS3_9AGAR|nr:hypothetical protein EST38_g289 [Candolleomyces aberdarensis]
MSSLLRPLAATATRAASNVTSGARSFHTPFALLGESPLTTPSSSYNAQASHYEKQYDYSNEPFVSSSGQRTYVVSQPDTNYSHYQVPAGAYPVSSPYVGFTPAEAPVYNSADVSSTAADILAHPFTSRAATPSSSLKGSSTKPRLGSRNPQPDGPAAEKFSKAGVQNAWKMRI